MRPTCLVSATLLLLAAGPTAAQYANRSVALEGGLAAPLRGGAVRPAPVAVSAALWVEGAVDATFRLAWTTAPRTGERGTDAWVAGTLGLRCSLADGPVRPQLFAEAGWSRSAWRRDRFTVGAGAGLEWFFAPDLALAARGALRRASTGEGWGLEATLGAAFYF
jgi:hypothetical protein